VLSVNLVAQALLQMLQDKVRNLACHHHSPFSKALANTRVTSARLRNTEAVWVGSEAIPQGLRVINKEVDMAAITVVPGSAIHTAHMAVVAGAETTATKATGVGLMLRPSHHNINRSSHSNQLSTFIDDFSRTGAWEIVLSNQVLDSSRHLLLPSARGKLFSLSLMCEYWAGLLSGQKALFSSSFR